MECVWATITLAPCKLNNESITVVEETAEVSTFEGSAGSGSRDAEAEDRTEKKSPLETTESVVGTRLGKSEYKFFLTESLILAQDERWRRA